MQPGCAPRFPWLRSNYNTATSETTSKSYITIVSKAQMYMKARGPCHADLARLPATHVLRLPLAGLRRGTHRTALAAPAPAATLALVCYGCYTLVRQGALFWGSPFPGPLPLCRAGRCGAPPWASP